MTLLQLPGTIVYTPKIPPAPQAVEIVGVAGRTVLRGGVNVQGVRPLARIASMGSKGPAHLMVADATAVVIEDIVGTLTGIVLDRVKDVTLRHLRMTGVGSATALAALVNGRRAPWRTLVCEDCLFDGAIYGDSIHFAMGHAVDSVTGRRYAPITKGRIVRTRFTGNMRVANHPDAVQMACATDGFLLEDLFFGPMASSLQITPVQNAAGDPRYLGDQYGSGQSTGLGSHRGLTLRRVTLDNAGAARIFNAPGLVIEDVQQLGRAGSFDLRATQPAKATTALPWIKPHPQSDWTTVTTWRRSRMDRLVIDPAVKIVDDPARVGGCTVGSIEGANGLALPAGYADRLRKLLTRPLR